MWPLFGHYRIPCFIGGESEMEAEDRGGKRGGRVSCNSTMAKSRNMTIAVILATKRDTMTTTADVPSPLPI